MTLLEVLRSTTDYLTKRQVENPRLNAEHLLSHTLGKKRLELYLAFEDAMQEEQLAPLRDLVRRRGQGEPLQHLLGTAEFCGHTFLCDKRALVPRPETEQLVEAVESRIENRESRILDVGTGSGVIALSLAAKFPQANVVATDVSEDALSLAKENTARLGLDGRVRFVKSDLFSDLPERFDLMVANLPYVSRQDRESLSREVLHDPETALFGGEQGDEVILALIDQAPEHLHSKGLLALEFGVGQEEGLSEALARKNYHDIEMKRDYSGTPRFLFARYG